MIVAGLEGAPRDDVDSDAEKFLEILEQAHMIEEGSARFKVHEQVQVAVWASLSPGDRAEHRDPMSLALPGDAEDLRAAAAQPLDRQHVIGHSPRISPRPGRRLEPVYATFLARTVRAKVAGQPIARAEYTDASNDGNAAQAESDAGC